MFYSLTFKPDATASHDRNTWSDWQLIPDAPPMIPFPEMETVYVEIPGRTAGPLDLTGVARPVSYKRITGSWTFMKDITSRTDRETIFNTLRSFFSGKVMKVVRTDDDPNHYFIGRFTVSLPTAARNPLTVTINYDLEPLRYNSNGLVDDGWINA